MPMSTAAFARAEPRGSAAQPPRVDFFPGRTERGGCFRSRPGAGCCRPPFRMGWRRAHATTAIRPACRRCARRLPIILRPRAGSAADPGRIVITNGNRRRASASPARLFLNHGHARVRSRTPCYQASGVRVRGDRLRGNERRGRFRGADVESCRSVRRRWFTSRPRTSFPPDIRCARPPQDAGGRGRGVTAATSWKTIATAICATKARRLQAIAAAGPGLHHLSRLVLALAGRQACGSATGRARAACRALSRRKRRSSTAARPGSNRRCWPG